MVADEFRARYRSHDKIRREGAIGNLCDGVEITAAHGVPTRLIARPGTGYQTVHSPRPSRLRVEA